MRLNECVCVLCMEEAGMCNVYLFKNGSLSVHCHMCVFIIYMNVCVVYGYRHVCLFVYD